LPDKNFN